MSNTQLYPDGFLNPARVGGFSIATLGAKVGDFVKDIEKISDLLKRPKFFVDNHGYECDIIAAAFRAATNDFAWVESKSKETILGVDVQFRLKAIVDGRQAVDWVVETYNPYFGCRVGFLKWYGSHILCIYREKHNSYACSLSTVGDLVRVEIDDGWLVTEHQLLFLDKGLKAVRSLSLPLLNSLPSLEPEASRLLGVLPPSYDVRVAARSEFEKRMVARSNKASSAHPLVRLLRKLLRGNS